LFFRNASNTVARDPDNVFRLKRKKFCKGFLRLFCSNATQRQKNLTFKKWTIIKSIVTRFVDGFWPLLSEIRRRTVANFSLTIFFSGVLFELFGKFLDGWQQ